MYNYTMRGVQARYKHLRSPIPKLWNFVSVNLRIAILLAFITAIFLILNFSVGVFTGILYTAPEVSTLATRPVGYSSHLYDIDGNQMTKLVTKNSNRIYSTIDTIPDAVQKAFIAIEDERFYTHNGIDVKGIFRAALVALKSKDFSQGASTITQQLLKNNVFTSWTTEHNLINKFKRKIQEQYLAIELEKVLDKDTILEYYLNTINLGQNTLGVQAAAHRYFGKDISNVSISEAAVLAAITQNPTKYNPISHPTENKERRDRILNKMLQQKYITELEYVTALKDDVYNEIALHNVIDTDNEVYTYFEDTVTKQVLADLIEKKGYTESQAYQLLYSGGLSIFTTQDTKIQQEVDNLLSDESLYPVDTKYMLDYKITIQHADKTEENVSTEQFEAYMKQQDATFSMIFNNSADARDAVTSFKKHYVKATDTVLAEDMHIVPQPQISVVICDQATGYVKAIVGGRGSKTGSLTLNRAIDTKRQPGSTFKIVSTYAPALDAVHKTLADTEVDEPFNYSNGRPVSNWYSGSYKGSCTLRYGIEQSLNIVTVKLLTAITPELGYSYLKAFGFTTLDDERDVTQSLALGGITYGVTNVELNTAYATIANSGIYIKPIYYTKVLDSNGNVLLSNEKEERHVLSDSTSYLLIDAMRDVVEKGTGTRCKFEGQDIAGKTGTTSDYKDVWFAGFTPYYTCTVWAGYDNNLKLTSADEKNLAKTVWKSVMEKIHEDLPYKEFTQPNSVREFKVCTKTGKIATDATCSTETELYAVGTEPHDRCAGHHYASKPVVPKLPTQQQIDSNLAALLLQQALQAQQAQQAQQQPTQ